MKNREKYREKILNYKRGEFCDNFIKQNILKPLGIKCIEISCSQCDLICQMWLEEECKEQEPEVDWSKVPVDTPILVRESGRDRWVKRHFAKYEDGMVFAWRSGSTSWSNQSGCPSWWKYAKLADVKANVKEEGK